MDMARQSAPLPASSIAVLVTRPRAEGEAFAAALTARFGARVRPLVAPLLAPRCLTPDLPPREYAAVVFTSFQAVEAARPLRAQLPDLAWCVGRRTAEAARSAGFKAKSADGDAEALIAAMTSDPPKGRILYLRGVDTAANVLERLAFLGMRADEIVVYVQEAQDLTPDAQALLRAPGDVILPVFSPRTARLLRAALPPETRARLHIAAMSANVAEALGEVPAASLIVARHPDGAAMMEAVESLLVGLPPP